MISLGLILPTMILILTKTFPKSWRVLRLYLSYSAAVLFLYIIITFLNINIILVEVLVFLLALLEASNVEHIINNNSNQNLVFIKFLFDPIFLKGSGLTKRFFLRLLILESICLLTVLLPVSISMTNALYLLIPCILMTVLLRVTSVIPNWLQENWIFFNLNNLIRVKKNRDAKAYAKQDVNISKNKLQELDMNYEKLRHKELGTDKFVSSSTKKNVLLIMVEGMGQIHFKKGFLPKLQARKEQAISLQTFINHQRNTNRGIYSLLTGKHPNLVEQMAKPDLVAQYGKMDQGVAEVLRENGYATVFLQAAPTVFMSKNKFLFELGFDEVLGEESFSIGVPRIKWGIDDHELYKIACSKIQDLTLKDKPWFLSLLTVSTHHPFQANNKILNSAEDGFRYADDELDLFLNELLSMDVTNETVIYITSDETAGDGGHILSDSLGIMIILTPEKVVKSIDDPFTQSDLAFSICDYLGIEKHNFLGRSFFQVYKHFKRPLYFSNIFQQKAYAYFEKLLYIRHYSGKREVLSANSLSLDCFPVKADNPDDEFFKSFEHFIEASDRGLNILTFPVIMNISQMVPGVEDVVKSGGAIKIGLKKNDELYLEFAAENLSLDTPIILNWLIQDMKNKRSFKLNSIILPNCKKFFEKKFVSPSDAWYDLSFKVIANKNRTWEINDLQVSKN